MKTNRLLLVAVLVGAMGLAPTELPLAQAAITATSESPLSVSTIRFGAVAGASSAATTTAAYLLPVFTTSCSFSNNTQGSNPSGSTTINMAAVTNYVVGMRVTATGIPAGAVINSIKATSPRNIVISMATTATISAGTAIVAGGCFQSYFSVNNIESTPLTSFGIQQIFTSIAPSTLTMQRCSGTWTEATGACTGAITTIVSSSATSAITTVPIALAASTGTARLRILSTKSVVSTTISVLIRRTTDVAAGTTSNS